MRHSAPVLGLAAAACFLAAGCSASGPQNVTGTVTLDGEPLDGADVDFVGKQMELGAFRGRTGPDGKFTVHLGKGTGHYAKPGQFVVLVTKGKAVGVSAPPGDVGGGDEEKLKELMKATAPGVSRGTLPPVYADVNTSPFTVEIKDGTTEMEPINLESKPRKR